LAAPTARSGPGPEGRNGETERKESAVGAVRWIGEGFKLVGGILTADVFNEWLETQGKQALDQYAQDLSLRWFRKDARARKRARASMETEMSSEPFTAALTRELDRLPVLIEKISSRLDRVDLLSGKFSTFQRLAVVPRQLVVDGYVRNVTAVLADSAELRKFAGAPDIFLRRQAQTAEVEFFNQPPPIVLTSKAVVAKADTKMRWNPAALLGHYYVVTDISSVRVDRNFRRGIDEGLRPTMENLGRASPEEVAAAYAEATRLVG
jgi:hypothetical protein